MKDQRSIGAESEIELHSLNFESVQEDTHKIVLQARVKSDALYALTVTMASPGEDEKARTEIEEFLSNIKAGFVRVEPAPYGESYEEQDQEPFDVGKHILFSGGVIKDNPAGENAAGFRMVVQARATSCSVLEEVLSELERTLIAFVANALRTLARFGLGLRGTLGIHKADVPGYLTKGQQHMYTSTTGGKAKATLVATKGSGLIKTPVKYVSAPGSVSITAVSVIVQATSPSFNYRIDGTFV